MWNVIYVNLRTEMGMSEVNAYKTMALLSRYSPRDVVELMRVRASDWVGVRELWRVGAGDGFF